MFKFIKWGIGVRVIVFNEKVVSMMGVNIKRIILIFWVIVSVLGVLVVVFYVLIIFILLLNMMVGM